MKKKGENRKKGYLPFLMGKGEKVGKGNSNNFSALSTDEARKRGKNGGIKSGQSRKKNKSIREALKALLSGKVEHNGEIMQGNDAIALSVFEKALSGDVQAFKEIRDTVGEKPVDKVEANVTSESQELLKEYLEQAKGGKLRQ